MDTTQPVQDKRGEPDRVLAALAGLLNPEVDPAPHMSGIAACLDHPEEPVRLLAAVVLGRIGAPAATSLIRALAPQQPTAVRQTAALGLASIGPPAAGAVRELCRCLTAPEEGLRNAAAVALAKIGAPAEPALRMMLRFTNPDALAAAVAALTIIGPPAAAAAPDLELLAARSRPALAIGMRVRPGSRDR